MNIDLLPGTYVVAVSGGVDSVVLLDLLSKQKDLELIVAHFDHGIRKDSRADRKFVAELAQKYELAFEYGEGNLGKDASEDDARKVRYEFLRQVREKYHAQAIVVAHHQDDVIETMFINLLRGTKHKGLVSLLSTSEIVRPLLGISKNEILAYAKKYKLQWREDSTNKDEKYLRNWIRSNVTRKLSDSQRNALLQIHRTTKQQNQELNELLADMGANQKELDRHFLVQLPHNAASEYVAQWLRWNNVGDFDKKLIERVVVGAKTLNEGKLIEVRSGVKVRIGSKKIELVKPA